MLPPRLPNLIAASSTTLPVVLCVATGLWVANWSWGDVPYGICFALAMLTTYLLMEVNNRYALIRIRTRITSSTFTLLAAASWCTHDKPLALLLGAMMAGMLWLLFQCYDQPSATLPLFHAYILIGIMSALCLPLLVLIPMVWFYLIVYLRASSPRMLSASLLGLLTVGAIMLAFDYWPEAYTHSFIAWRIEWPWQWGRLIAWPAALHSNALQVWLLCLLAGLAGLRHYASSSYDDKIKARILNRTICALWVIVQLLIVLSPWQMTTLLPMQAVLTAPIVGHHLATVSSLSGTLWFWCLILMLCAVMI